MENNLNIQAGTGIIITTNATQEKIIINVDINALRQLLGLGTPAGNVSDNTLNGAKPPKDI